MQKCIIRVALFRWAVEEFEKEVNEHLADGWMISQLDVVKQGLRIVCVAVLDKRHPVAVGDAVMTMGSPDVVVGSGAWVKKP